MIADTRYYHVFFHLVSSLFILVTVFYSFILFYTLSLIVGILALTRQWKNQLYMPFIVETQARRRRGAFTVHFDVPKPKGISI